MSKEFETFKDKIFSLAKKYDSDVQISYSQNRDFQVRYQNGDMDQYTDAGKFKINVLVLKDGKLGSSYTETFEDPEKVFLDAYENIS
ncbi:MAG: DNA gyrase modulator, partial [Fervidobacterium sp.]